MGKRLIVNADDFNLTDGVSRGILEAHRRGIVTSTTVMVNLAGLERAAPLLADAPRLSAGLHVNLTLGAPVLPPERLRSLVDAAGCFIRDRERLKHVGKREEVVQEVRAQARRFVRVLGRTPTHLDSHYHMHRHPVVLEAVLEVAAELQVPVRALDEGMAEAVRLRGLASVDRAEGDVGATAYWTVERLRAFLHALPEGTTEVVAHPGYWDPALAISSYGTQREDELHAFCDSDVRAALGQAGVQLISYREL